MNAPACSRRIGLDALLAYWLGEQDDQNTQAMDLHLLSCDACGIRLDAISAMGQGIRKAFDAGLVRTVIDAGFARRLADRGLRLREYRVQPGGSVACTVTPEDDVVISRLVAPLEGLTRVDLLRAATHDQPALRAPDIPFDAASGEVWVVMPAARLRAMPARADRIQLVGVAAAGEQVIGEYTFNHRPST